MAEDKSFLGLLKLNTEPENGKPPVIAVVGGGGKTSLIYALTKELTDLGKKVIVTTTTHMAAEPERPFAQDGDPDRIREALEKEGYVLAAGAEPETGKLKSLSEERLRSLTGYGAAVLIEADGANRKPFKIPRAWEPVIPDFVNIVIGVTGLDCLYQPISSIAHKPELAAAFLGKEPEALLEPEDLVKTASSFEGLRKDTEGKEFRVYLNKSDVLTDASPAKEIVRELKKRGIEASCGSLGKR